MMNAQRNRGMYLRVGERLAEIRKSRKISQTKLTLARCGLRRSRPCADARHRQTVNEWPVPTGHRVQRPVQRACNGSNKFVNNCERPDAQSPAFIPTERHVSRYRNEIATGREDPGTRAVSHRRGVCDPRPTVRGAWARSKHHLDHSES